MRGAVSAAERNRAAQLSESSGHAEDEGDHTHTETFPLCSPQTFPKVNTGVLVDVAITNESLDTSHERLHDQLSVALMSDCLLTPERTMSGVIGDSVLLENLTNEQDATIQCLSQEELF